MTTDNQHTQRDDGPERIVSGSNQVDDDSLELSLRPRSLSDFVGQNGIKDNLNIGIQAAKLRGESLDHVIIYGLRVWGKLLWLTS